MNSRENYPRISSLQEGLEELFPLRQTTYAVCDCIEGRDLNEEDTHIVSQTFEDIKTGFVLFFRNLNTQSRDEERDMIRDTRDPIIDLIRWRDLKKDMFEKTELEDIELPEANLTLSFGVHRLTLGRLAEIGWVDTKNLRTEIPSKKIFWEAPDDPEKRWRTIERIEKGTHEITSKGGYLRSRESLRAAQYFITSRSIMKDFYEDFFVNNPHNT